MSLRPRPESCVGQPVKSMPELGAERVVIECITNLEQPIGATLRPLHLLGFVHALVDQEVRCAFGDGNSDAQTGTASFGIELTVHAAGL